VLVAPRPPISIPSLASPVVILGLLIMMMPLALMMVVVLSMLLLLLLSSSLNIASISLLMLATVVLNL
jgi:hypothetical protein